MIQGFKDKASSDIYHGHDTREARKISKQLWKLIARKLDTLNGASVVQDLRIPSGNRLEKLTGRLSGKYSIRVNDQYRIVFSFKDGSANDVQVVDYH
ncbi:MAG: type II toxin-antitoxin system RelE/ParE family toxin [Deltaproteobacteria bacterium]|nr:MAG: type II toxin-antitoxin system RelE/ParE family toxin [Deltaproteobacteria bacterium]